MSKAGYISRVGGRASLPASGAVARPPGQGGIQSKAKSAERNSLGQRPRVIFILISDYPGNEIEQSGSYRSDLRCAIDRVGRSRVCVHPHWIRMRKAQRDPSPLGCRKHNHLGRPHAPRTLCRRPEYRSRALLVSASLVFLEEKARPQSR